MDEGSNWEALMFASHHKLNNLTAIILCGGKGLRLRPLTNDLPKPLILIDDKPILEHIINHFIIY